MALPKIVRYTGVYRVIHPPVETTGDTHILGTIYTSNADNLYWLKLHCVKPNCKRPNRELPEHECTDRVYLPLTPNIVQAWETAGLISKL